MRSLARRVLCVNSPTKWMFPKIFWLIPVTGGDGANILMFQLRLPLWLPQLVVGLQSMVIDVSREIRLHRYFRASGVCLDLDVSQVANCIETLVSVLFCTSASLGDALRNRTKKRVRDATIFNVLGPLTNPASAPNQVLGVFDETLLTPLAEVLRRLGSNHVLVVYSEDGLDELSVSAASRVAELVDGRIVNRATRF